MAWLTLGTRGSPLAMAQARMTAEALSAAHGRGVDEVRIEIVRTTGDAVQDRPLAEIGGKALWTKELDAALLDHRIDLAVHSLKDVETELPPGIVIAAVLPRADVREVMVGADSLAALPHGARLGTSSPRRAAQALARRPDLRIISFRGNVDTRIQRIADGEAEATLLAAAGLERLGRSGVGAVQPIAEFLPAPSQGAIGVSARAADADTRALLAAIDHGATHAAVLAERGLLAALGASCHSCVAAHARFEGAELVMDAEILTADGRERVAMTQRFAAGELAHASAELAGGLLGRASAELRASFGTR